MHPTLTIAKRAAYSAGAIITRRFDQLSSINSTEKSPNDYVSEVDLAAEEEIIKTLRHAFPDYSILAEESGLSVGKDSRYCWVIDPIDGTTNFIKGFPHFAISIALLKDGKPEAGLVFQPFTDEMFLATRGQGATLNDRKIRVSKTAVENAIIAVGIPFRHPELLPRQMAHLRDVLTNFPDIRRSGSAALDLCYVAAGRVDGYFELGLSQWDIAAGALIAQESGALVSDMDGNLTHLETGNILAAPPKVYKNLIKITTKHPN